MFQFHKQGPKQDAYYLNLLEHLTQTKNELDLAYQNFENVTEPELIDCYIYELNAIQMRYKFLLARLKSYEMTFQMDAASAGGKAPGGTGSTR